MIDKVNISIENKLTNKIKYWLDLDEGFWCKIEYDDRGKETYFEESDGYWYKREYNNEGKVIYFKTSHGYWYKREYDSRGNETYYENSRGIILDDRTN